jgi:hypothetical protein
MPTKKMTATKKPHRSTKTTKKSPVEKKKLNDECNSSEQRFVRDLLIRGEAVKPLPDGSLPPGATHKIVEQVERERFSLY